MRNRYSPVIVRGTSLGLPTSADLYADEAAALKRMPTSFDLPYSDGEPMDSPWHRNEMYLLIDSLSTHWKDRSDVFIGGDMFVYFSDRQEFNRDFRGPDFFVVKGADRYKERVSWVSWNEDGRLPDLIIELISPTTASVDRGEKKKLYGERFRTHEYFCYDPTTDRLEGWRLPHGKRYQPIEPESRGRMWSEMLDLYLDRWNGMFLDLNSRWMRFFTKTGELVLTANESAAAALDKEVAKTKAAETENAKLRRELKALRKKRKP